jgi:5-methylcytosine-specific restriction endonuclease McrA
MIANQRACNNCKKIKPITGEFWQAIPNSNDGFRKTCLECKSAKDKLRYQTNKRTKLEAAKSWYRNNSAHKREYDQKRRREKADTVRESRAKYAEKVKVGPQSKRIYFSAKANAKRFAQKDQFVFTVKDINRILDRQRNECFYCQYRVLFYKDIEIDHVLPKARGGRHSKGNIVIACGVCNREKSYRTVMEYKMNKIVPMKTLRF